MLPINWLDDIGMKVTAAFLNLLGSIVNDLSENKFRTWTQSEYDALEGSRDPDVIYFVTED